MTRVSKNPEVAPLPSVVDSNPTSMSTFPEPDVRYGERLLPFIVDEEAAKRPDRVLAMMPKSSNISEGWIKVNAKQLADSINLACWWIEEQIGKPKTIETIAYLV